MLLMIIAPISASVSGEHSPLWPPLIDLGVLVFAISALLTVPWLAMTIAMEPQDRTGRRVLRFPLHGIKL